LEAVNPCRLLEGTLSYRGHTLRAGAKIYDLRRVGRIAVVGAGKATIPMAIAVRRMLGTRFESAFIVAPRQNKVPRSRRLVIAQSGHPIPDRRGLRAARRLMQIAKSLSQDDLLIVLLSGGASSLLPLPVGGLSLSDKQRTTQLLLHSGATIGEVNAVRKHLSGIKGGQLAEATQARVLTILLSDVRGDDIGTIGSGPTAPDPTTFRDAVRILREHGLWSRLPVRVRIHLVEGLVGWQDETPKARSRIFTRAQQIIIGNNRTAVDGAIKAARKLGYDIVMIDEFLTGEAAEAGKWMGKLGLALQRENPARSLALLAGGELTVTIRGKGRGGRAQEFALAAALSLEGSRGVWAMSVGTDGRDGPTDVAGAIVDGSIVARGQREGLKAAEYLRRNDSYTFFKRVGGHIVTGPTGTNVNDLYLLLIHPSSPSS
jgi:glycerate 2-kinase